MVECSDGSYYAGYTNYIEKRIQTHNSGKGAKVYTRQASCRFKICRDPR